MRFSHDLKCSTTFYNCNCEWSNTISLLGCYDEVAMWFTLLMAGVEEFSDT